MARLRLESGLWYRQRSHHRDAASLCSYNPWHAQKSTPSDRVRSSSGFRRSVNVGNHGSEQYLPTKSTKVLHAHNWAIRGDFHQWSPVCSEPRWRSKSSRRGRGAGAFVEDVGMVLIRDSSGKLALSLSFLTDGQLQS